MKRLTYTNYKLSRNVSAHVGLHIWDADKNLMAASIVGAEASVKALVAAAQSGEHLTSEPMEGSWAYTWKLKLSGEKGAYNSLVRLIEPNARKDEGLAHGLLLHKAATDPSAPFCLLVTMGEGGAAVSEAEAFWRLWIGRWSVPGLESWAPWVWDQVKRRHAAKLAVYQSPDTAYAAYRVDLDDEKLGEIVTEGLKARRLVMPAGPDVEGARLDGVKDVTGYLTTFGKGLARQVSNRFRPLFVPGESPASPALKRFGRKLFAVQGDVAQAMALALAKYGAGVISAEMGTGKTAMGAAVPFLLHNRKGYRWIVMCPPHLVDKWVREIKVVVPEAFATIVRSVSDLEHLAATRPHKAEVPEYIVISREAMKLGSNIRPSVLMGHRPRNPRAPGQGKHDWHYGPLCPHCGALQTDKEGAASEEPYATPKDSNSACVSCREPLWAHGYPGSYRGRALRRPLAWQDVNDVKVLRRFSLATYLKKKLKHWADGAIVDELHELKSGETAQGNALGALAASVRYVLALTGTLTGGYATDLFSILYRMRPALMKAAGFEYHGVTKFAARYGRVERITKETEVDEERNVQSKGKKSTRIQTRPGISPRLFGEFLMPFTGFLELADLGHDLPPFDEEVELLQMEPDLAEAYRKFSKVLRAKVMDELSRGSKRLLGAYLQALINYPDKPFENPAVVDKKTRETVATPADLEKRFDRAKVARLAQICLREKSKGRRVLAYAVATNTRDVQPWMAEVLRSHGLKVAVMYGRLVKPEAREAWIAQQVKADVDVVICNPGLVATGLDLLDFPTIVWFQTGYSTFTLRQASRRSWRLGQTRPVKVIYLAYRETLQESCLQLMGTKLAASMGLEGKFSEDGLMALCESEDMTTALAKALVSGLDGEESAEAIWRKVSPVRVEEEGATAGGTTPVVVTAAPEAVAVTEVSVPELVTVAASAFFRRRGVGRLAGNSPALGGAQQLAFSF